VSASSPTSTVRVERRGPVAILWLDAPPVNILSARVLEDLSTCLREVERDPEARAIVLASASERAFAAGANIREMSPMGPAQAKVHGARGQGVTALIEHLPLPVVAAVHGTCVGGGCEIALACDLIVASEDATFGQPEINLGVMPGWGGTRRLPRRVGAALGRWWIFSGEPVGAEEARRQGLVLKVVQRAELLPASVALAETLAKKPALALAAAKYAVNNSLDPEVARGLRYELALWSHLFGTPDQREGMSAFLEKRAAGFASRSEWDRLSRGFPWQSFSPARERPRRTHPHTPRRRGKHKR
jgi:enoyl-CoA hydratase